MLQLTFLFFEVTAKRSLMQNPAKLFNIPYTSNETIKQLVYLEYVTIIMVVTFLLVRKRNLKNFINSI